MQFLHSFKLRHEFYKWMQLKVIHNKWIKPQFMWRISVAHESWWKWMIEENMRNVYELCLLDDETKLIFLSLNVNVDEAISLLIAVYIIAVVTYLNGTLEANECHCHCHRHRHRSRRGFIPKFPISSLPLPYHTQISKHRQTGNLVRYLLVFINHIANNNFCWLHSSVNLKWNEKRTYHILCNLK